MTAEPTSTTTWGAAFRAKYPDTDLVYFATRNNSYTNNSVWALSSVTGQKVWSVTPGNMDIASGGMMVDYANKRLWVAARAGETETQPSLWVIDVLNPAASPRTFNLGDIDGAVVRNAFTNQVYVVNNAGIAYGFDLNTLEQVWSLNIGAVSGFVVPVGSGFTASTANGVQRYAVDEQTQTLTAVWTTPTATTGPTAPRIDFKAAKAYLGDSFGKVHRLDLATGAKEAALTVSAQALAIPALDVSTTPKRLYVGGLDGRLCAIDLPW